MKRLGETNFLYSLEPARAVDPETPHPEWLAEQAGKTLCPKCNRLLPGVGILDVKLKFAPSGAPVALVQGLKLQLFDKSFFMSVFGEKVGEFWIGSVAGPDGLIVPNLIAVRGTRVLEIRGSANGAPVKCNACRRRYYFPLPPRYVLVAEGDLPDVASSSFGTLLCRKDYIDSARLLGGRKVIAQRYRITETPSDGLPAGYALFPIDDGRP